MSPFPSDSRVQRDEISRLNHSKESRKGCVHGLVCRTGDSNESSWIQTTPPPNRTESREGGDGSNGGPYTVTET